MKRRVGEPVSECKHGIYHDWCALCTGQYAVQTVKVHTDDQCYVPDCKRRARKQTGPVELCEPHTVELENAWVSRYKPEPFRFDPDPDRKRVKPEYVYFVRIDDVIKIGFSTNVANRVRTFAAYGHQVEVLAIEWGDRALEKRLHRRFDHLRSPVGLSKELFVPAPEIFKYIRAERTCAFCKQKALHDRAVCMRHEDKYLYDEQMIGWATARAPTASEPRDLAEQGKR